MTDNEIIKALESFIQDWIIGYYDDEEIIVADVLSLINRQKAEIERLSVLAKLGDMRANDYRAMRNKYLTARADTANECL